MSDYYCISDRGERAVNEDTADIIETYRGTVFLICDGLGGHGKGDEASALVARCIREYAEGNNSQSDSESFISEAINSAQNALLDYQSKNNMRGQSKTTLALLYLSQEKATVAHIGDTRVYKFRNNKYLYRTLDHSVPQMLVSCGEINEKQIRRHEDRNRLLRCMGINWEKKRFDIDALDEPYEKGDSFILCSDGLWDWILENDMEKALKKMSSAQECAVYLAKLAQKRAAGKNMDNFSIIVVRV